MTRRASRERRAHMRRQQFVGWLRQLPLCVYVSCCLCLAAFLTWVKWLDNRLLICAFVLKTILSCFRANYHSSSLPWLVKGATTHLVHKVNSFSFNPARSVWKTVAVYNLVTTMFTAASNVVPMWPNLVAPKISFIISNGTVYRRIMTSRNRR